MTDLTVIDSSGHAEQGHEMICHVRCLDASSNRVQVILLGDLLSSDKTENDTVGAFLACYSAAPVFTNAATSVAGMIVSNDFWMECGSGWPRFGQSGYALIRARKRYF